MKKILEDIKSFKGNVLCICVDDEKITKDLFNNKNIGLYELSRNSEKKILSKNKKLKDKNGKSIKIKKFRKFFKKKSIEYILIDLNNIFDFYKYMASNSIYVCRKKIYLYGNSDYLTAKDVAKKFERYNTTIEKIQDGNNYLVIVDCSKAKYNFFKEKLYLVVDSIYNFGDLISYFLTS